MYIEWLAEGERVLVGVGNAERVTVGVAAGLRDADGVCKHMYKGGQRAEDTIEHEASATRVRAHQ
jgi:hypothetical protein